MILSHLGCLCRPHRHNFRSISTKIQTRSFPRSFFYDPVIRRSAREITRVESNYVVSIRFRRQVTGFWFFQRHEMKKKKKKIALLRRCIDGVRCRKIVFETILTSSIERRSITVIVRMDLLIASPTAAISFKDHSRLCSFLFFPIRYLFTLRFSSRAFCS